jgi:NADPH:quinone reductase-like Zn-dependent oxidoreductase
VGRVADLVIDTVTGGLDHHLLEVLKHGGTLLTFGLSYTVEHEASADVTIQRTQVYSSGADLTSISHLIDAGQVRVAIDTVVPLEETSKAHERGERGHLRGKIVLRVAE